MRSTLPVWKEIGFPKESNLTSRDPKGGILLLHPPTFQMRGSISAKGTDMG